MNMFLMAFGRDSPILIDFELWSCGKNDRSSDGNRAYRTFDFSMRKYLVDRASLSNIYFSPSFSGQLGQESTSLSRNAKEIY